MTSSKMAAKMAAILDFTKNSNAGKIRKLQIFFARVVQCDRIKHFATFGSILCFLIEKR